MGLPIRFLGFLEERVLLLWAFMRVDIFFKRFNLNPASLLLNGSFKSFFSYVNGSFLLLVMGGSIFSYFSISLVLDYFLQYYELYVWSWFFGMIIGSVYYIGKDFGKWNSKNFIFLIFGITLGLGISLVDPATQNDNLWFVFFCGVIISLHWVFSGSFILILLGNYVLLLVDSVNVLLNIFTSLLSGNFEVLSDPIKIRYLKIIAVFTGGSAFGLISISHVLGYVLKRWNKIVNAVIIGFITGSLGTVWPWKNKIYVTNNKNFLFEKDEHPRSNLNLEDLYQIFIA